MCLIRHFSPCFANDVNPLVFIVLGMLLSEGKHIVLDEDQAGAAGLRNVAPPPAKASLKRSLLFIPMKVLLTE